MHSGLQGSGKLLIPAILDAVEQNRPFPNHRARPKLLSLRVNNVRPAVSFQGLVT